MFKNKANVKYDDGIVKFTYGKLIQQLDAIINYYTQVMVRFSITFENRLQRMPNHIW